MRIISEISLENFEAWSGGKDRLDVLIQKGLCDELESIIENDIFPNGCSDTDLNDLLWFDDDFIAECLGFSSWEALESGHDEDENENEDEDEDTGEIEYAYGITEKKCATFENFCDCFGDCCVCPYDAKTNLVTDCKELFDRILREADDEEG